MPLFLRHRFVVAVFMAAAAMAGFGQPAHAASAKQIYSKANVDSEINLKVMRQISQSMYSSFTQPCGARAHGATWSDNCNPALYSYGGTITYICVSGNTIIQSQSCK